MHEIFGTPPPTTVASEAGSSETLCVRIDDTPSMISDTSNKLLSPIMSLSPVTPLDKPAGPVVASGTIGLFDHYEQLRFARNVADERERRLQAEEQRHARDVERLQAKLDEANAQRAAADEMISQLQLEKDALCGRIASLESHATQQKTEILGLRERCVSATADRDCAGAEMENRLRAAEGRHHLLLERFRTREGKVNQYKASTEHWRAEAQAREKELEELRSNLEMGAGKDKGEIARLEAKLAERAAVVEKLSKAAFDAKVEMGNWRGRANRAETKLLQLQSTQTVVIHRTGSAGEQREAEAGENACV